MRVSLGWLREFVAFDMSARELARRLTMAGLQVDAIEERGRDIASVLVARITAMEPHPRADRLTLCTVRAGSGDPVRIVCGARNMKPGDLVPFAPAGSTLPGGRRIEAAEIRGITSNGMLCSGKELGLSEDAEGLLILPADAPVGSRLGEYLGLEDTVLEVAITPNRGDCLSILGIAREVAALTGARVTLPASRLAESARATADEIAVRIDAPELCGRYAARVVRNVRIAPSPGWMRVRLAAAGLRPINNVVDVTNYVMMERGQPLHAFDLDRLPRREIVVRRAGATRTIRTLDGKVRQLAESDLLITTGDEPIAIAGVMGGEDSEVGDATTSVLLESAWFDPSSVRRTKRRLDLPSEAAYRFERGVDADGVRAAIDRAAELLSEVAGGEVLRGVVDEYPGRREPRTIPLRPARCGQILGLSVGESEIRTILESLGASVAGGGDALAVTVPSHRSDLEREIDLVEEVARIAGYERIEATTPAAHVTGAEVPERMRWGRTLGTLLGSMGLHETIPSAFTTTRMNRLFPGLQRGQEAVRVSNPINLDEPELRRSLLPALLAMWDVNRSQGARGVAGFALNKVFWKDGAPREAWRLAGILAGRPERRGLGQGGEVSFADAKGVVEAVLEAVRASSTARWSRLEDDATFHPGKSARVNLGDACVGVLGSLHPEVEASLGVGGAHWLFELDIEEVLRRRAREVTCAALPRFPEVVRDLALVVDADFVSAEVQRVVLELQHPLVRSVELFDQYSGPPLPEGKKNLAYSISYRAADRTLTDDEVNEAHRRITGAIVRALGGELRR